MAADDLETTVAERRRWLADCERAVELGYPAGSRVDADVYSGLNVIDAARLLRDFNKIWSASFQNTSSNGDEKT